ALAVVGAQPPDPRDGRSDRIRPGSRRDGGTKSHERVAARLALPVERTSPSEGELDLDHRLEPVDVGSFEQADFDQAHGPGRIASGLDCPRCPSRPRRPTLTSPPSTDPSNASCRPSLQTSSTW